jgi:GNAT superfamily N-acetyltransferase
VSDKQQRTPPGDPWAITLTYRHEQPWWYGADDALETWHVSADISDGEPGADAHVGDISITLVDLYQTHDPFALLDGADAELGRIAEALFDPDDGQLDPKLDERLEPAGDRILILHSVRLTPQWRGFGFGALLAGTAIRKLSGGARAAVCYPAPLGGRDEPGQDDPPDDHENGNTRSPRSGASGVASDSPTTGTVSTSWTLTSSRSTSSSPSSAATPSAITPPAA